MNYNRQKGQFKFRGVNLNRAMDEIPPDQLGIGTNVRPNQQGTIGSRPSLGPFLAPSNIPINSIKTFVAQGSPTRRFSADTGGNLYMDNTLVDTGYSGNPLSFASYQPSQADEPFLYVADSLRFSKLRASDGTRFNVGIVPPSGPPVANLANSPLYEMVSNFDTAGAWTAGGTGGSVGGFSRVAGGTTVLAILYDSGSTGWACVAFNPGSPNPGGFNKGAQIEVGSEFSIVQNLIPAPSPSTTTIAAIAYDSGTSGLCCVVLASNTNNLQRDALVELNSEYVRVLSVAIGEDNTVSFRCSTVSTHAVSETVTFVDCSRMYFNNTHAAGDAVSGAATEFTVTTGTGYITAAPTLDLSQINGRPLTPDDWMHISLWPAAVSPGITQALLLLDVDQTTNTFTKNYYYIDITNILNSVSNASNPQNQAAQLAGITSATTLLQIAQIQQDIDIANQNGETALAAALQASLAQIEGTDLQTGAQQWLEIQFPLSSLVRVGTDETVSLANVKAIRVQFTTTTSVVIGCDSWWVGGTYGPNAPESINPENPIKYCFRYRSTITGDVSSWSPLTRGGLFPERQGVTIKATGSSDAQVDTMDFARVGASVDGTPLFLGSSPNTAGTVTFNDNYSDAQLGDQIEPGNNQPWPLQQKPITGTCSVVGTSVFATSVAIPTNLCEGTIVLVGGVATVIRGLPTSNAFQVEDNLDTGTGVQFQINAPTTFGNPLPYMMDSPFDECLWAMGDPNNPTRIYFTNRTNPGTAKTSNFVNLPTTNAGLGVAFYNNYVVAMTSEGFFAGTTTGDSTNPYAFGSTSVGTGLLAPWAFAVGPAIFFWSRNGINATALDPAKNISNDDLYPYLPHEGLPGIAVNGYAPPPVNVQPRMAYCKNGWLYFEFLDTNGAYRSLAFDTTKPGWWFDSYTPGVLLHYQDETDDTVVLTGCADGTIRQFGGVGEYVIAKIRLGASNFDDIRSLKQAIDIGLNINGLVDLTVLANSWTIPIYSQTVSGVAGTVQIVPVSTAYDPSKLYLDLALDFLWSFSSSTGLQLIEYDFGYLQNPMLAADFVSNPTPMGFAGYGHVREVVLNAVAPVSLVASLVINCEFPGTITVPVTIPAGVSRQYVRLPANKGMLYEWALQGNGLDLGLFSCDAHVKGWTEESYRTVNPFTE